MSETKEVVSGVIEDEVVAKDGELTDADLDQVAGGMAGIQALLAVCSAKANTANQDALDK
jgi:hypothetical protein